MRGRVIGHMLHACARRVDSEGKKEPHPGNMERPMAQRDRDKSNRTSARAGEGAAGLSDAVQRLEARAKALERERDGLKAELDAARVKIRLLEEKRSEAVNRIDWVIDSLHNVINKSP